MHHYVLPALFALFVWWFSTGVIMFLDGLPRRTFRWSMLGATALLGVSFWGLHASSADLTVRGAYLAFTWGLLAWGWQEISFYMGYVTGPRTEPCPENCRGWRHFGHAIQTSLWHELAIIAAGLACVALTWHAPNQVGTWTFMVLWWMHQSAKLNVFLGVRNLNEEFLPEHLQFLRSFLTKKPMNLLFPVSVTVSTVIAVHLVQMAVAAATPFAAAGFTFLATMMVLAILEHWLLMLPLPAAALWGWSLRSRGRTRPFDVEVVAGFLGAGKTTFLRNVLSGPKPEGRTVVLVNDFAAVGVDGSLLRERGADVVELPNGCICCSLRKDLTAQLREAVAKWSPDRVLIEPSGVADLAALLGVLSGPTLKPMLRRLTVSTVIDAGAFGRDFGRMRAFIEAQARAATRIVVNKLDLVSEAERGMIETTLRTLNPSAAIVGARFGIPVAGSEAPPVPPRSVPAPVHRYGADPAAHDHHHRHDEDHHHHHHHGDGSGLLPHVIELREACDPTLVSELLDLVAAGRFGAVERLKGLSRTRHGWMRFDVAGGPPSLAAFAAAADEVPRVIAIGRDVQAERLAAAFAACVDTSTLAA
ncbi:MAG: DUF3623 family protein [Gluconacetobacter diazotrophicus]|nr:DUF3623 family protein [Gluconacetobacter diazotrophicus]